MPFLDANLPLEQMEPGLDIDRIDVVVMSKTILLTATRQDAHHTRVARATS